VPPRTPRPCRNRGCPALVTSADGLCDDHKNAGWERHQAGRSRHERGYGSKWDKIRLQILVRDNHLCQSCRRIGLVTPASIVDHITPKAKGGTDDIANLEAICRGCHASKTAVDRLR
jgi:5-methylcytosine-specific restriction enzyme A